MLAVEATKQAEQASTGVWIEAALIIFLVVFLAIVAWTVFSRSGYFRHASQIPLDDQTPVTPRTDSTSSASQTTAPD